MERKNIASGAPWEEKYGYSRAVRVGQHIFVAGTTASDEAGNVVGKDDVYVQAVTILRKIETALPFQVVVEERQLDARPVML